MKGISFLDDTLAAINILKPYTQIGQPSVVRVEALTILSNLQKGDPDLIDWLKLLTTDRDFKVKAAAINALGKHGTAELVLFLQHIRKTAAEEQHRGAARRALVKISNEFSRQPLY